MMPFNARELGRLAFLSELYTRSAGDARQGVPYEALIDALGFSEAVTKRLQRALQAEGLVELTTVPPVTHVGRPVMDCEPRDAARPLPNPRRPLTTPPLGPRWGRSGASGAGGTHPART